MKFNEVYVEDSYVVKALNIESNLNVLEELCKKVKYISALKLEENLNLVIIEAEEENLEKIKTLEFILSIEKERKGKLCD